MVQVNLFKAVGFLKRLVTQKYAPSGAEIERIRYALKPTHGALLPRHYREWLDSTKENVSAADGMMAV